MTLMGQVDSTCFGTNVTIPSTPTALSFTAGMICPPAGSILVSAFGKTDRVTYTGTGGVDIDLGNNGGAADQLHGSCLDSNLCACPSGP